MTNLFNVTIGRRSWLYLGEVVTLLTFMGYHVLPDSPNYQPNFMIEMKRRIYYHIYNTHMTLVSLTGRPPLMNQSFNTTPLPLDLSDLTLFGEQEEASIRAKADISDTGWDKYSRSFSVSFMRARSQLSLLREEIMHFALNTKRQVSIEELL